MCCPSPPHPSPRTPPSLPPLTTLCVCVCFSGWITAFTSLSKDTAVGGIMIMVSILFTFCAVLSVILLKMVS